MLDLVCWFFPRESVYLNYLLIHLLIIFFYYILNVCRIFSDSPSFSPHIGNFDFLSNIFFLISLAKDFQSY